MTVEKYTLKNNLRVLTIDLPDSLSTTILFMVKAGSRYESKEENGIAHYIEHTIFKGSEKYRSAQKVSYEIESLGGQSNAFTMEECTGYYIKSSNENFPKAFDILSDIFLNSLFDEKELETEKGVVIEELRMYEDQPEVKVGENFDKEMFDDDHLGQPIGGYPENISKFTREMVLNFKNRLYTSDNVVVVIAGKLDKELIKDKVEVFESVPRTTKSYFELSTGKFTKSVQIQKKDVNQTHLIYGTYGLKMNDPKLPNLMIARMVLGGGMGSELFLKLREKLGIAYYVNCQSNSFEDRGLVYVSAGVDNKRIKEAVEGIKETIENAKKEKITEESFTRARELIKSYYTLDFDSSDDLAEFLGIRETVMGKYMLPEEILEALNKVTIEDVHESLNEIWSQPTHLSLITGEEISL